MGKLTQIINEKIEKIKPEKILTDLTQNTDPDVIADFVNSKKKDERLVIAANPNLTIEQQTKLSNDRVNAVKQALCYNANLDLTLAKQLLDEEPDRIDFIAKYGNSHLDMLAFDVAEKKENDGWKREAIIRKLVQSPNVSDEAIEKIIKDYPKMLGYTEARKLHTNQNLSKKAVYMMVDYISDNPINSGDYPLTRIISNQRKYIKEADIKKMDWKNNSDIQGGVVSRDDISENFTLDVIKNLNEDTSITTTFKKNPNSHMFSSISVLNALMKRITTFKLSYNHDFHYFSEAKDLPLDPRLMIDLTKHLQKQNYNSYLKYIISNKNFPEYGLDELEIDEKNFGDILRTPSISDKRVNQLVIKYVINESTADKALWGLAENKTLKEINRDVAKHILDRLSTKSYWFEFIIRGKLTDEVIKDYKKYGVHFATEWNDKPIYSMLHSLSKNRFLTSSQKRKILDVEKNLPADQIGHGNIKTGLTTHDKNPDPDFFEELMELPDSSIWDIWTDTSSTYFQYDISFIKTIDKIALKTKDAPRTVLYGSGNKTFTHWVNYNNEKDDRMSNKTAEKYLIHFIKTGEDGIKDLLKTDFLDSDWLTPDVMVVMYDLTGEEKYLPQAAKDIFLF